MLLLNTPHFGCLCSVKVFRESRVDGQSGAESTLRDYAAHIEQTAVGVTVSFTSHIVPN